MTSFASSQPNRYVVGIAAASLALLVAVVVYQASSPTYLVDRTAPQALSSFLVREDPEWTATSYTPLTYFAHQSPFYDQRSLSYWPGMSKKKVLQYPPPEREEAQGPSWVGSGYGVYLDGEDPFSGNPILKHGFMSQSCVETKECQNADVCCNHDAESCGRHWLKCIPAIYLSAEYAQEAAENQTKARYGAEEKQVQVQNFDEQQLHAQQTILQSLRAQSQLQLARRRGTNKMISGARRSAKTQDLAMGGGTPVDLSFGVGRDGEPPYQLKTEAESVYNGLLNPNAPGTLPYAQFGGSGTSGQIAAIGYSSPLQHGVSVHSIVGTVAGDS